MDTGRWDFRAISTHALLAEGDHSGRFARTRASAFQPTPSLRRATPGGAHARTRTDISTHALLAEGDPAVGDAYGVGASISTHALLAEGD